MGQLPITAKYKKVFLNLDTGQKSVVTDLQSKISKRDCYLKLFCEVYGKSFKQKNLSLLSAVVNQDEYITITKFINMISRKLKRKGIERLGYVWVRDIGDKIFKKHFHVIIATSRIDEVQFKQLFCKKRHNCYDIEFVKTPEGILSYLIDKNLFGAVRQRSYGKSRRFPHPTQ